MRALSLTLLLVLASGCERSCGTVHTDEDWPESGVQGLIDGCVKQGQREAMCRCLAQEMRAGLTWSQFLHHAQNKVDAGDPDAARAAAMMTEDPFDQVMEAASRKCNKATLK